MLHERISEWKGCWGWASTTVPISNYSPMLTYLRSTRHTIQKQITSHAKHCFVQNYYSKKQERFLLHERRRRRKGSTSTTLFNLHVDLRRPLTTAVWPDVGIKTSPKFPKMPKKETTVSTNKVMLFKKPRKLTNILAPFVRKFVAKNFQKSPNLVTLLTR